MQLQDVAQTIEISIVQSHHSLTDLLQTAEAAKKYHFAVVYSLPGFTKELSGLLKGSDVAVGGVISFPSGGETREVRIHQAETLLKNGAQDFDMVLNLGYLKAGRTKEVREDIEAVRGVIGSHPLKVIMEVSYLTDDELRTACQLIIDGGGDYAKTGTGWAKNPTQYHHIEIMREVIQGRIKMKASGGVRGLEMLMKMHDMGVSRFGIREDAAIAIINEINGKLGK